MTWRDQAACRDMDTGLFYVDPRSAASIEPRRVCASCPSRLACLVWAIENEMGDGLWGGLSLSERSSGLTATEALERAVAAHGRRCTQCATPIVGATPRRRFCTETCRIRHRRRSELVRRREAKKMREYRSHARTAQLQRRGTRLCAADGCAVEFVLVTVTKRFCSKQCQHRERQRRWRAADPERARTVAREQKRAERSQRRVKVAA